MSEFRHAWRGLIRRPAYAIATVGTLAIVIGVNAALFAAINVTLLRPIALKSGERTVQIYLLPPRLSDPKYRNPRHAIDLVRFRERSRTLTHIAAFTIAERVLGTGTDVDVVSTLPTNAEMLRLSIDTFLADSLAPRRFRTTLMIGLAIVGLLLGAIGTAGVTARTIADRMPEFGVRLALGCDQSELWRGAVIQQLRVVGIGSVAGLAPSVVVCKTIASMLPETAGVDPVVMAGSVAALVSTAALAAAVPASRVMWLNPLAILRSN
jgi:ABC-type antimicrobial peptide transport system permease subunit